eukprot:sb/3472228/
MKAYSTVLSQNCSVITPKVVKNAATPRSSASYQKLKEKPVTKSMKRVGQKLDSSSKPRPLVISLENRESLLALLRKAKLLKQSENFSSVFFSPDLIPVQQKERKRVVETVKKLRLDDPNGKYFIQNGIIKMVRKQVWAWSCPRKGWSDHPETSCGALFLMQSKGVTGTY